MFGCTKDLFDINALSFFSLANSLFVSRVQCPKAPCNFRIERMTTGNKCMKKNGKGSAAAKSTDKKEM